MPKVKLDAWALKFVCFNFTDPVPIGCYFSHASPGLSHPCNRSTDLWASIYVIFLHSLRGHSCILINKASFSFFAVAIETSERYGDLWSGMHYSNVCKRFKQDILDSVASFSVALFTTALRNLFTFNVLNCEGLKAETEKRFRGETTSFQISCVGTRIIIYACVDFYHPRLVLINYRNRNAYNGIPLAEVFGTSADCCLHLYLQND